MHLPADIATPLAAAQPKGNCIFAGKKLEWVPRALRNQEKFAPVRSAYETLRKHTVELTPGSERLANFSLMSLMAPWKSEYLMDEDDATCCLECVIDKVVTRAGKRAREAEAAAAAQEHENMIKGEASERP